MSYYDKQGSSTPNVAQVVQLSSAVAVASTAFSAQTRQIRIISPTAVWAAIGTSTTVAAVGTAGSFFLAANTASGDYFSVNPGQIVSLVLASTASTGTASVLEMT